MQPCSCQWLYAVYKQCSFNNVFLESRMCRHLFLMSLQRKQKFGLFFSVFFCFFHRWSVVSVQIFPVNGCSVFTVLLEFIMQFREEMIFQMLKFRQTLNSTGTTLIFLFPYHFTTDHHQPFWVVEKQGTIDREVSGRKYIKTKCLDVVQHLSPHPLPFRIPHLDLI